MPRFRFSCVVGVSAVTEVDADTIEQAKEIAEDRAPVISNGSDGWSIDENWLVSEADGTPRDITLDEIVQTENDESAS